MYSIDSRNTYWGGKLNNNHVYDIYTVFGANKDSVKSCLEKIEFVAHNEEWYSWNYFTLVKMNNISLADWINRMSYFSNSADVLAIYDLSDMLSVHTLSS